MRRTIFSVTISGCVDTLPLRAKTLIRSCMINISQEIFARIGYCE